MAQAITVVSVAYNAARALGPTLAGVVFAYVGSDWVFGIAVVTTVLMWESIRRWPPKPHPPSRLPAERLWGGTMAALRFARHSDLIFAQLLSTMAYSAAGSARGRRSPTAAIRRSRSSRAPASKSRAPALSLARGSQWRVRAIRPPSRYDRLAPGASAEIAV